MHKSPSVEKTFKIQYVVLVLIYLVERAPLLNFRLYFPCISFRTFQRLHNAGECTGQQKSSALPRTGAAVILSDSDGVIHIILLFSLEALCPHHRIPAKADVNQAASLSHSSRLPQARLEKAAAMSPSSRMSVYIGYIASLAKEENTKKGQCFLSIHSATASRSSPKPKTY